MIFIKGMKMPKDCIECRFFEVSDEYCYARGAHGSEWGKSTGCPLVEIKSPLGFQRYIDYEIRKLIREDDFQDCVDSAIRKFIGDEVK